MYIGDKDVAYSGRPRMIYADFTVKAFLVQALQQN